MIKRIDEEPEKVVVFNGQVFNLSSLDNTALRVLKKTVFDTLYKINNQIKTYEEFLEQINKILTDRIYKESL